MYTACYINNKNGDAQELASQRYPAAMFVVVLAVMNIELSDITKHWQLINNQDADINKTWNTLTAKELGRLF